MTDLYPRKLKRPPTRPRDSITAAPADSISKQLSPAVSASVLGLADRTGGTLDSDSPNPSPLAAELFTKKDPEAAGLRDSTDDFLTEDAGREAEMSPRAGPHTAGPWERGQERRSSS